MPRFTREFEAHHLVLSLRSCSCAAKSNLLFSRLYDLYVDAAFHDGGGWLLVKTIAMRTRSRVKFGMGVWLLVQLR